MKAIVSIAVALLLVTGSRPAFPASRQARDVYEDAGAVRGPLSDFWYKVRSEWSGYMNPDPQPPPGGGPLKQRTFVTAPPNRAWVSLVFGALTPKPLSHLFAEFLSEWKLAEGRNWPYAQIYDRRWDRMGKQGRTQNIIMIGTPWTLEPVGPLAGQLGFTVAPGRVEIGKRRYRGDNLILIFIAPNPANPGKYALVITGTNDEGLMQAGHLPYGETDYVLFRGRRLLESGFFSKTKGAPAWGPPDRLEATTTHSGFAIRETAHYTFWYETDRHSRDEVDALATEKEAAYPSLAALLPDGARGAPRITYYLYPTVDRKIDETARADIVHLDLAASEIHAVFSETQRLAEPYLDLMVLLHRVLGPTRAPRLERALAIALAPQFQGHDVDPMAARLFQEARGRESAVLKSLREQDVTTPADGPPSEQDVLLSGFMRHLVLGHGRERVYEFLRRASPRNLDDAFREVYGERLNDALGEWAALLRSSFIGVASRTERDDPRPEAAQSPAVIEPGREARTGDDIARGLDLMKVRDDAEAARVFEEHLRIEPSHPVALVSLARIRFRAGRFEEAERTALSALTACAEPGSHATACPRTDAWSHLTLGRIEALRGRYVAARVELTHPAVTEGPDPVPTLAEYWLETMGQSRNQLTVISHLKREARVSLRNLDWDRAEEDLNKALQIDPTDSEAHRLLSEVYHKHHEYWAWQIRYLNDVHPDYNVLGRMTLPDEDRTTLVYGVEMLHNVDSFNDLVLKGNLELMKAQSLYAVEIQNLHQEGERFLLEEHDTSEALRTYLRALDLNGDFFLSHFLVGRCYFLMERFDEARRSFEEVLKRRPGDASVLAWTHTYLGYIALEQEELTAAKHAFEKALSQVSSGKVGALAREGLGKVSTIRLLMQGTPERP
ncbi:MAG TPA: tetratricopeptide repeat protein [Candidatus Polarisedimenticolia bacterium]|jgi:tetratricopeptide (TPR) repeat protein